MRKLSLLGSVCIAGLTVSPVAWAAENSIDLGAVGITGSGDTDVGSNATPGTASAVAPVQGSLYAVEPQTIISDKFLRDILPPNASFVSTVALVPSVTVVNESNGPGGNEAKIQLRGFKDGEFNVTFDGIPFGDANDPSHHATAYFPAGSLGKVIVDRGPGYASTMGYATYGGTVALFSPELTTDFGGTVEAGSASFGTRSFNALFQSGVLTESGTRFMVDFDGNDTEGYLQNAKSGHRNIAFKGQQPLGDRFVATLVTYYNDNAYDNISQITLAQAAKFGRNYAGLRNDPTSSNNVPYNLTRKRTDMSYLDIAGDAGWFQLDNKFYTYAYYNRDNEQKNQNSEAFVAYYPKTAPKALQADATGLRKVNQFRAWGDIASFSREIDAGLASGTARAGFWWEYVANFRDILQVDQTLNVTVPTAAFPTGYQYNLHSYMHTLQPFVEYEWRPLPGLSITPGYKHFEFSRHQVGHPNQGGLDLDFTAHYNADMALLSARYRILPELSVYAEAAQGFLVPPTGALYIANPANNNLQPSTTMNWQTGVVWKSGRFTADADLYLIDVSNLTISTIVPGTTNTTFFSSLGGVRYQGIEGEGTFVAGAGFSLFGAGSLNSAKTDIGNLWVPETPEYVVSGGVIYDQDGLFGSLIGHVTGPRYAGTVVPNVTANKMPAISTVDFAIGYRFGEMLPKAKQVKVTFGINNLLNHRNVLDSAGALNATNTAIDYNKNSYYWQVPRNYYGSVAFSF